MVTIIKGRSKQPAVRRDQLLDSAERLFAERGYTETTVMDIAEATGVAKGTFYLYFPSKEHCVVALKARLAQGLVDKLTGAITTLFNQAGKITSNIEQITRMLIDESFEYALEHADTFNNLFHRGDTIEIDQASLVAEQAITETLTDAITKLNELGLARVSYPAQTARILFNGIHWALDQAVCREGTRDLGDLREAAVEVATRALGVPTDSSLNTP